MAEEFDQNILLQSFNFKVFLSTFLFALMESAELHGISTRSSLNSPVHRNPSCVWVPKTLIICASHYLPAIHPIMLLNILLPSWFQLIYKFLRVGASSYICILHCTHISLHFDHYKNLLIDWYWLVCQFLSIRTQINYNVD